MMRTRRSAGTIGECAMRNVKEKRAAFRKLHESGCFVIPNPWDVGTARLFQHLGFEAIAATSTGLAWSMGQPDYTLTREDVLHQPSVGHGRSSTERGFRVGLRRGP